MPLVCPDCRNTTLKVRSSYDYPGGDEKWDELSIQVLFCGSCKMEAMAIYQESRRGASDIVYHTGYRLPEERLAELEAAIRKNRPGVYTGYITKPDGAQYKSFPVIYKSE